MFKKVGVVGAGTMGTGITQLLAQSGYDVVLVDHNRSNLTNCLKSINKHWTNAVNKQKMTSVRKVAAKQKISTATELSKLTECDIVIEAITEKVNVKLTLLKELDDLLLKDTILASNTSTISITLLGGVTKRPEQVIGMHFMNPAPVMKLVEVIRGLRTSDTTFNLVRDFAIALDKQPVQVNDYPGFVSNRLLMPFINEAVYTLKDGVASKEDIDKIMKLGMAHPMGPLELADLIGLDVCLLIMERLYEQFEDPKYRVCPLLREMVDAGFLGRKSGKGFYDYS